MRKVIRIQLITIGFFLFLSVIASAQNLQKINVGKGLKSEKPVLLQDIAQEIEYIRLETCDKCLIGGAGHLIAADAGNIIVVDKAFYRFGRDGKFQNSISGRGKGPGEFVEIAGFDLDPGGGLFYIFDRLGKVMKFNLNGDLIHAQRVSPGLYATLFDKDLVLNLYSTRLVTLSNGFRVVINDLKGNPVRQLLKVDQKTMNSINYLSVQNTRCYNYRDSTTIWEGLCDTVYRISKDFRVIPRFYLDLGKDRLPRILKLTPNSPDYRREIDKYIMPMKFFETDRYLYLETSDKGQQKYHLFNKDDGVCTTLPGESRIINDFDGGPDFWPMGITSDGKMYMLFNIIVLKEYWKPNTENTLKYPERQQEFVRMLEKCDVNDNPIIMLVTPGGK